MARKYSVILGNLGNTCDRFCSSYKENPSSVEMLANAVKIQHVEGIELVGTWDVTPENAGEMKKAFDDNSIKCVSIIPDLFATKKYWKGSYSAKDVTVRLETPAGMVEGTVTTDDNGKVTQVSLIDVPSFAWVLDEKIDFPGCGEITVDVGFGGNFFVIVEADQLGIKSVGPEYTNELIEIGVALRKAANEQIKVQHPTKKHISTIDISMITAPPSGPHADARNIVILGEAQADRSPCGTGTCARMSVLHRKGQLAIGELFRHESSICSVFEGEILSETTVGEIPAVVPKISCRPYITGFNKFVIDAEDPFAEGFTL